MDSNKLREKERAYLTLLRWLRSRPQREYEWKFSARYWRLRHCWQTARLRLQRRIFEATGWLRSTRESVSMLEGILGTIAGQLVLALLIVATLTLFENWLVQDPRIMGYLDKLPIQIRLNSSFLVDMLGGLAQIAGVFLGLYFAAVSVIASTVYARVPGDVRSLLMRERIGNFYIRLVALLGAVAVLRLALSTLGFVPGILTLVLVTFLGTVAILSFVVLGMGAFHFFDPSRLVGYLAVDLLSWIRSATPSGSHWHDPAFQSYYQRKAESVLTTYRNVVSVVTMDPKPSAPSLRRLAVSALRLQEAYTEQKLQIPSDSHWFKRAYRHRDWLTADYTRVSTALQTATALQPELVPDLMWVETRIGEILSLTLQRLFRQQEDLGGADYIESTLAVANEVQKTLQGLSKQFAIVESLHVLRNVKPLILARAHEVDVGARGMEADDELLRTTLALVDLCSVGLVNILLGFSESLRVSSVGNAVSAIDWDRPSTIYASRLPRHVTNQLEYLAKGLDFERKIEGHMVTPLWYRKQIAAAGFSRFVSEAVESLARELEVTFADEAERFVKEKRFIIASQIVVRGLEACDKYRFHFGEAKEWSERLVPLRKISDIPWPSIDWDKLDARVGIIRERLLISVGRALPALGALPQSEDLPDYFGHAYSVLANECSRAMTTGKEDLFSKLFPFFFSGWLSAFDRLRKQWLTSKDDSLLALGAEPLVDILDLSGYALVYSELDGKGYWDTTKRLWDDFFAGLPSPQDTLRLMMTFLEYRRSIPAMLPRDPVRTSWKQDLERRLRDQGLLDEFAARKTWHPSAVIRSIVRGSYIGILYDLEDVFVCVYLMKRPEASGLKPPWCSELFRRSLEAEQPRRRSKTERERGK